MQTDQLYCQYAEMVRRYMMRFVSESDAADLVQEVFIKVNNNIDKFRGDSSVKTWVYRIAVNTVRDFLNSKAYQVSKQQASISEEALAECDSLRADNTAIESNIIAGEMNECIFEFIQRLPYDYSSVLVLSLIEGYKGKEVAEILGINLNTVKVRLHRAKLKLKSEMEKDCNISVNSDSVLECERKNNSCK